MHRSTVKIALIAVITSIAMLGLVGLPVSGVLKSYLQVMVVTGAIGASVISMGWARRRTQNNCRLVAKLVVMWAIVAQAIIFLLLGLKLGFAQNVYGWNLASVGRVFLPLILVIVAEEILRGQLVDKGRGDLGAVIVAGVALWLVMVSVALPAYNLAEPKAILTVGMVVLGPMAITNILLTYIAYMYDYRINIVYRLIMDLPFYILPIIPDAGKFLPALFEIMATVGLALMLVGLHKANTTPQKQNRRTERDETKQMKRISKRIGTSMVVGIVLLYVMLISGMFKYYFLAISSGSMEPNLERGDMVLVEKSEKYSDMAVGDVLVYRYQDVVMVHRIVAVDENNGEYIFRTQGDNNASMDSWQVMENEVVGLVRGKIAMFGFPTLWINELFNKE